MTAATPGQAAYKVRNALAEAVRDAMTGAHDCRARRNCDDCTARYDAVMNLADRYAAAQQPQPAPGSHVVTHTPAVARPSFGGAIILAVSGDQGEDEAREAASALAALNQGIAVITVRGVDALRTWEPEPQPAPELAAAMAESRRFREGIQALIADLEQERSPGYVVLGSEIRRQVAKRLRKIGMPS